MYVAYQKHLSMQETGEVGYDLGKLGETEITSPGSEQWNFLKFFSNLKIPYFKENKMLKIPVIHNTVDTK